MHAVSKMIFQFIRRPKTAVSSCIIVIASTSTSSISASSNLELARAVVTFFKVHLFQRFRKTLAAEAAKEMATS